MTKEQALLIQSLGGTTYCPEKGKHTVDLSTYRSNHYEWEGVELALNHLIRKSSLGLDKLNPAEELLIHLMRDFGVLPKPN